MKMNTIISISPNNRSLSKMTAEGNMNTLSPSKMTNSLATGTHPGLIDSRRTTRVVLLAAAVAAPRSLAAQAVQRSMTVSVVNDSGAPVEGLGPTDFVVREDNVSREVLRVAPADEPMQIALLVDTSTASRDNIAHFRTALPQFVTMLTNPNASGAKNQVAIVAT